MAFDTGRYKPHSLIHSSPQASYDFFCSPLPGANSPIHIALPNHRCLGADKVHISNRLSQHVRPKRCQYPWRHYRAGGAEKVRLLGPNLLVHCDGLRDGRRSREYGVELLYDRFAGFRLGGLAPSAARTAYEETGN